VNNLEKIRLPHCINVRGEGLSPLRGSIVLKRADLCIVSEEVGSMTPKLSIDAVLPIFDSIMAVNQNSMRRLHIPKIWRDTHNERLNIFYVDNYSLQDLDPEMSEREKSQYRTSLLNRDPWDEYDHFKMDCAQCNENRYSGGNRLDITCEGGHRIETCPNPKCGRKYCCEHDDEYDHARKIKKCDVCKVTTCEECSDIYECTGDCDRTFCTDCKPRLYCHTGCDSISATQNCIDCAVDGSGYTRKCGECNNDLCKYCDPDMIHLGTGEHVCEVCRGVDEADWHGPDNPANVD